MRFSVRFLTAISQRFRTCLKLDALLLWFFDEIVRMWNCKGPVGKLCHGVWRKCHCRCRKKKSYKPFLDLWGGSGSHWSLAHLSLFVQHKLCWLQTTWQESCNNGDKNKAWRAIQWFIDRYASISLLPSDLAMGKYVNIFKSNYWFYLFSTQFCQFLPHRGVYCHCTLLCHIFRLKFEFVYIKLM